MRAKQTIALMIKAITLQDAFPPGSEMNKIKKISTEFKLDGNYFRFVQQLRQIMDRPLAATMDQHGALNINIKEGHYEQLPFRVQLSTFGDQDPITSYGCIVFSYDATGQRQLLMIKRERSIEFIDFVRGQYRLSHLYFLVRQLPLSERQIILDYRHDYQALWNSHWCSTVEQTQNHSSSFNHGRLWFEKIEPYLEDIFRLCPSQDPDGKGLYIFPKGRLDYRRGLDTDHSPMPAESKLQCAMREYREETGGCPIEADWICYPEPIGEVFVGSNSKNYATMYFIFQAPQRFDPPPGVLWINEDQLDQYMNEQRLQLYQLFNELTLQPTITVLAAEFSYTSD